MRKARPHHYPKPGAVGGKLIREVIATFRTLGPAQGLSQLPITAYILIAVSGGCDSIALAHLLIRYGRRVGGATQFRLVHVNHGWRGKQSDADESFVRAAGKRWGVPVSVVRVKPKANGQSPEEAAREQRKIVFARLSKKYGTNDEPAWIITAHHADDLAETLVWRFFTGALDTHGGGISFRHGQELRPLLRLRKEQLIAFLKEEGEDWREDRTNFEGRLMRSRMRMELMPIVESLFPRAVEHVAELGLKIQKQELPTGSSDSVDPSILFSAAGLKARRAHWEWLKGKNQSKTLTLPGGWVLRRDAERWILEKVVT